MPMTHSIDPVPVQGYTRASVEAYLRAAATERARIEAAIIEARLRTSIAREREQRLSALGAEGGLPSVRAVGDTDGLGQPVADRSDSLIDRFPVLVDHDVPSWDHSDLPTAAMTDRTR